MGATIIENTLRWIGICRTDHKASLEPQELADMVKSIRNIEKSLGNGVKVPSPSERKNIEIARKSIVARCTIKKGDFLTEKISLPRDPEMELAPCVGLRF